jgi:hypothetical protein
VRGSGECAQGEVRPIVGLADVDGWPAGVTRTGLARMVWLVTAALLLGVALLTVVVGQGVAAASELQAAPDDAADSSVLPAAETAGDGVETDQAAGPKSSETGDEADHDFTEATAAATVLLAQPVTLPPEGSEEPGSSEPGRRTVQPESWGKAYRPEDSEGMRQERVEEDGVEPDGQPDGAPGRGVDVMLASNEVYLAIGGTDTPGAPYAHAIPATAADAISAAPRPPGTDRAAELADDLDPLAVTVTAQASTHPDQGGRTPLTADATSGIPQAATSGAQFDPAGLQSQPAPAVPAGESEPARDAFLPGVLQATTTLVVAPMGAGSSAVVIPVASAATSGVEPGQRDQPHTLQFVLDVGDGATTGWLPVGGDVLILPDRGQLPPGADDAPLVALQPAGAAALAADAQTSSIPGGVAGWVEDNWEYLAAAGMIGVGVVVLYTGVGGILVASAMGSGLLGAGGGTAVDKYDTGSVNWTRIALMGGVGGAVSFGGSFYALLRLAAMGRLRWW